MASILHHPDTLEKLNILAADAQYDLSCACGTAPDDRRRRGMDDRWLYPVPLQQGGKSILFKTLVSNQCQNDCKYCPLRANQDGVRRCRLSPEEIVKTFMPYWKSRRVIGLFLTSAVHGSPDATMEHLVKTAEILRYKEHFKGYLHLKLIPGASEAAFLKALSLSNAVSLNIETAGAANFEQLTRRKDYMGSIIQPLKWLSAWTQKGATHSRVSVKTQFVVGAANESDRDIVRYTEGLYRRLGMERVYFSAYQRGLGDASLPGENSTVSNADLLMREHRLYQTDFLLRKYGFKADEVLFDESGKLPLDADPKEMWARRNPGFFPVDIQRASREELLRVPGFGLVSVNRILEARKNRQRIRRLEQAGLPAYLIRKAMPWIRCE